MRFFNGIQVFALEVFDQRHLEHLFIGRFAHDDRHDIDLGDLRRAPTAFAGDEFVFVVIRRPRHEWLNEAGGSQRNGEVFQRRAIKIFARLGRAWLDIRDRHTDDTFHLAIGLQWLGVISRAFAGASFLLRQQRAQPPSQSGLRHARFCGRAANFCQKRDIHKLNNDFGRDT